ncbi:MAG: molybdopterin molybdotransferase MoeA [Actinomycetaceae bacterium]|nr:molybdopterin molybdotransferase MoeA [Actinomycetaceae bacterium]
MISLERYLELVRANLRPVEVETVDVRSARGQVLASPLIAQRSVPAFDNSAMDGFAVRHRDLQPAKDSSLPRVWLPVTGQIPAGPFNADKLPAGSAMRIMTGACIPDGADTVIAVEDTDCPPGPVPLPTKISVPTDVPLGCHIRRQGEDVKAAETLACEGSLITPALIAACLAVGVTSVQAYRKVRVFIVSTGDELQDPQAPPHPGMIPDTNAFLLSSLVQEAGAEVIGVGRSADTVQSLLAVFNQAAQPDLVITTAGVSAGAFDVVKALKTQADLHFHKVAMQPGKPQGYGSLLISGRQVPILALPGNPVSAFVSFHTVVRAALNRLSGKGSSPHPLGLELLPAQAAQSWTSPAGRTQLLPVARAHRSDAIQVSPICPGRSVSHRVASLHRADAIAVVPAEVTQVNSGDAVSIIPTI